MVHSLLSAWKCRRCRGTILSASPFPQLSCFPKLLQGFPVALRWKSSYPWKGCVALCDVSGLAYLCGPNPSPVTVRLPTSAPQDSTRYHPLLSLSLHVPFPLPETLLPSSSFFQLTTHPQVSQPWSLFLDSLNLDEISLTSTLITPILKLLSHDLVVACLCPSLDNKPLKSGPILVLCLWPQCWA